MSKGSVSRLLVSIVLLCSVVVPVRSTQPGPSNDALIVENGRAVEAQPAAREIAADAIGAGAFQLALDVSPDKVARAFLLYDLTGLPNWTAAVRSINGLPALGGFGAAPSSATQQQIEEINPRWLRAGANQVLFSTPDGAAAYTVQNLRIVYVEGAPAALPNLTLSYPRNGEHDADGTLVRG